MMQFFLILVGFFLGSEIPRAFSENLRPKILVVVAHPDDEYYFAATLYRLALEKGAQIDEMILTNGEAGFRYSDLAEKTYQIKLTDEKIALKQLPEIRKQEARASAKVLGIHDTIFLGEKDFGYTQSAGETSKKWNQELLLQKISDQLKKIRYDFVFLLTPIPSAHGHHKAATLLALQAASAIPESERPILLAASIDNSKNHFLDSDHESEVNESRAFRGLQAYPISKIALNSEDFTVNRNEHFGYKDKLSYQIIVNWMIAEHKSQGAFQAFVNRDDKEVFRMFALSPPEGLKKTKQLFDLLKDRNP